MKIFITVGGREQVIITQFGQYIPTIQTPGLALTTPFLQSTTRFDRRTLAITE